MQDHFDIQRDLIDQFPQMFKYVEGRGTTLQHILEPKLKVIEHYRTDTDPVAYGAMVMYDGFDITEQLLEKSNASDIKTSSDLRAALYKSRLAQHESMRSAAVNDCLGVLMSRVESADK